MSGSALSDYHLRRASGRETKEAASCIGGLRPPPNLSDPVLNRTGQAKESEGRIAPAGERSLNPAFVRAQAANTMTPTVTPTATATSTQNKSESVRLGFPPSGIRHLSAVGDRWIHAALKGAGLRLIMDEAVDVCGWLRGLPRHSAVDLRRGGDGWHVLANVPGVCTDVRGLGPTPEAALAMVRDSCDRIRPRLTVPPPARPRS